MWRVFSETALKEREYGESTTQSFTVEISLILINFNSPPRVRFKLTTINFGDQQRKQFRFKTIYSVINVKIGRNSTTFEFKLIFLPNRGTFVGSIRFSIRRQISVFRRGANQENRFYFNNMSVAVKFCFAIKEILRIPIWAYRNVKTVSSSFLWT